jgi:hypothetical protein
MTQELVSLKKRAEAAKAYRDGLGLRNVNGRTTEELVQLDIEYKVAEQKWLAAYLEYDKAVTAHSKQLS